MMGNEGPVFRLSLILMLAVCLAAFCEEIPVYTLDDCIQAALENSAAARKAERDREIGKALMASALSDGLPQLSLSATYTRLDELQEIDLGDSTGAAGQPGGSASTFEIGALDNYQAAAEVSQLLFSGGRVRSALRAAKSSREYYDWSASETEDALVRDIRTRFHAILFAAEAVLVREESVSNLTVHVEQAEQKHRSGTISEFDLISARVKLANEEPPLISARNAYALSLADLRRLLGIEGGLQIDGELVFAPLDCDLKELQETAVANRPGVHRAEMLVRLRESDASAAAADNWPSLRAFFNYTEYNPYGFASEGGEWEAHWIAGLTAEWNLWDGGLTLATIREKRLETEKARIDVADLRLVVRLQVEAAYLAMEHAARTVSAGDGNVELALKALEIAGRRYEAGLGTHLEFTESALALSAARLSRIQSLRDYADAIARLQYACGLKDRDLYTEMRGGRE